MLPAYYANNPFCHAGRHADDCTGEHAALDCPDIVRWQAGGTPHAASRCALHAFMLRPSRTFPSAAVSSASAPVAGSSAGCGLSPASAAASAAASELSVCAAVAGLSCAMAGCGGCPSPSSASSASMSSSPCGAALPPFFFLPFLLASAGASDAASAGGPVTGSAHVDTTACEPLCHLVSLQRTATCVTQAAFRSAPPW